MNEEEIKECWSRLMAEVDAAVEFNRQRFSEEIAIDAVVYGILCHFGRGDDFIPRGGYSE